MKNRTIPSPQRYKEQLSAFFERNKELLETVKNFLFGLVASRAAMFSAIAPFGMAYLAFCPASSLFGATAGVILGYFLPLWGDQRHKIHRGLRPDFWNPLFSFRQGRLYPMDGFSLPALRILCTGDRIFDKFSLSAGDLRLCHDPCRGRPLCSGGVLFLEGRC